MWSPPTAGGEAAAVEELPPRWNRGGSCSCLRVAPCEAMREGTETFRERKPRVENIRLHRSQLRCAVRKVAVAASAALTWQYTGAFSYDAYRDNRACNSEPNLTYFQFQVALHKEVPRYEDWRFHDTRVHHVHDVHHVHVDTNGCCCGLLLPEPSACQNLHIVPRCNADRSGHSRPSSSIECPNVQRASR